MPPSTPPSASVRFAGLDALRFAAAFAVVYYHTTLAAAEGWSPPLRALAHNLAVGVDLFFIISGFLITYLLLVEKGSTGTISLPAFYLRRALRIFPLYYAVLGLAYCLYAPSHPEINFSSFAYFGGNFWLIQTGQWTIGLLTPLWSLCIEEQFYLVIPLLVLLLPTRWLPWLFGGIIGLSAAFRYYVATTGGSWMTIYVHTLSRCDVLAMGGLLAWRHYTRPIRWQLPASAFYAVLALLVVLLITTNPSDFTTVYAAVLRKYLTTLPLLFLFSFVVFNHTTPAPPVVMPAVNYLGRISYGLYMYHALIIEKLYTIPYLNTHLKWWMFCVWLLTAVVAAVSYELFEKPILRLKQRFERVRTVRA